MTCPNCQSELVKGKTAYLCLHCGWSGKSGQKAAKAASDKPAKSTTKTSGKAKVSMDDLHGHDDLPTPHQAGEVHVPKESDHIEAHESTEALVAKHLGSPDHIVAPEVHVTQHQAAPPPPKSRKPARPVKSITLIVVIVAVIAALLIAYVVPALAAANSFNKKFGNAQSYRLNGSLTIKATSFLSVLNSNLTFSGAYVDKGKSTQLDYKGTFASRTYDGSMIAKNNTLYTKMTGNDLPFIRYNQGIATYHLLNAQWYSTKTDNSLYKYYCETKPDTKYPSALAWYQAIRQVKLHPSPLVAYGASIDGHSTTHVRGTINGKDLNAAWSSINSTLPPGCEWNNLIEDVSHLNVNYDLYTSAKYDQIQLHFNDKQLGVTGTIVLKLDDYNAAPAVTAPASSTSLADIFSGRAAIQAKDYQRRTDVDNLKKALDAYAKANKSTPPSSLAKLAPKYIAAVPKDPNGSEYKYVVTKKTYTLTATLEDAGQQYTVTGP